MNAQLHAMAFLGLLIAVGVVGWFAYKRPTPLRIVVGLLLGLVGAGILYSTGLHKCHSGYPWTQSLLSGVAVAVVVIFVGRKAIAAGVAIAAVLAGFGLCHHYVYLVHKDHWHGHQTYRYSKAGLSAWLSSEVAQAGRVDSKVYPRGPLAVAVPGLSSLAKIAEESGGSVEAAWHSSFTRLFHIRQVRYQVWYPGGRLSDGASGITIKAVPRETQ